MVVIIDYGMGNLGSVRNMLKKLGYKSIITSDKDEILNAQRIILPGVGSFDKAMNNLKELNLIEVLNKKVLEEKTPILGICLGMQLLTNGSEEGKEKGLGYIDAFAHKFNFETKDKELPIPHMGWNITTLNENKSFNTTEEEYRFYFVHSFAVTCNNPDEILFETKYGYNFVSAFQKDNILGAQFHPEKSHKFGMQFFKNFLENS